MNAEHNPIVLNVALRRGGGGHRRTVVLQHYDNIQEGWFEGDGLLAEGQVGHRRSTASVV